MSLESAQLRLSQAQEAHEKFLAESKAMIRELQHEYELELAKAKFAALSDAEKDALVQMVKARGIDSKEDFGEM
jgi:hypothetical protein